MRLRKQGQQQHHHLYQTIDINYFNRFQLGTTHKEKTNFLHNSSNCIGPSFVNLVIKTHQFLLCFQSWLTLLKDKISLAISIPEEKHMHPRDTGPLHLHLGRTYRITQESMFPEMVLFHFLA